MKQKKQITTYEELVEFIGKDKIIPDPPILADKGKGMRIVKVNNYKTLFKIQRHLDNIFNLRKREKQSYETDNILTHNEGAIKVIENAQGSKVLRILEFWFEDRLTQISHQIPYKSVRKVHYINRDGTITYSRFT